MRTLHLLALSLVVIFSSSIALGHDDSRTFVEGHVSNKSTGVPLAGAWIEAAAFLPYATGVYPPPPPPIVGKALTNSSGFYSFEVDTDFDLMFFVACGDWEPDLQTVTISPMRPGTIRRDLYLDVGRRRTDCTHRNKRR